jgi:hypothetical protein
LARNARRWPIVTKQRPAHSLSGFTGAARKKCGSGLLPFRRWRKIRGVGNDVRGCSLEPKLRRITPRKRHSNRGRTPKDRMKITHPIWFRGVRRTPWGIISATLESATLQTDPKQLDNWGPRRGHELTR